MFEKIPFEQIRTEWLSRWWVRRLPLLLKRFWQISQLNGIFPWQKKLIWLKGFNKSDYCSPSNSKRTTYRMNYRMFSQCWFLPERFTAMATLEAACVLRRRERLDRTIKDEGTIYLIWLKTNLVNHKHMQVSTSLWRKFFLANRALEWIWVLSWTRHRSTCWSPLISNQQWLWNHKNRLILS